MSDIQNLVDSLAMEYFEGLERGAPPDVEKLTSRLPDESSREELRRLIDTARWARKSFPETLRSETVLADRYVLIEELGSGGYGKVWKARDLVLGRVVAIKVFHPLHDPDKIGSILRRERLALARVNHPSVVRCYDSGKDGDHQFLTMEYVEGVALDHLVQQLARACPTGWPDRATVQSLVGAPRAPGTTSLVGDDWFHTVASILVEILGALALAHGEKVFHRDLKPQNVILRPGARPVVLDFGLAGLGELAAGSVTQRLFGTLEYLAPEQMKNEQTGKDCQTDIYQCGLILYELLAFQRAFPGKNRTQLVSQVGRGVQVRPGGIRKGVPAALEDICMKALEVSPDRRYPSAEAFLKDLERFLEGQVPSASRLGMAGRLMWSARQQVRRHRVLVSAAGVVMMAVAATVLAMPDAPDFVERRLDAAHYQLTVSRPMGVFALVLAKGEDGKTRSFDPVQLKHGPDGRPEDTLALAKGGNDVHVHEPTKELLAGSVGLRMVPVPAGDEDAVAWISDMRRRKEQTGRSPDVAEALASAQQLRPASRGPGEFDLERALRKVLEE
ncbi:MAG: hypothetical protein RL148_2979 [Planctomycetota bacterium]|jgi:hypothetical protein